MAVPEGLTASRKKDDFLILPALDSHEQPLETLLDDGGLVAIFRTIACIGDSLSSGEFEALNANNQKTYHDMYEYSWGQYIARIAGLTCHNFSRGGMTAREYLNTFADSRGLWNTDLASQAYIMALGVNDVRIAMQEQTDLGQISDIDFSDWRNNRRSFIGDYAAILQRYRAIRPDSFLFLMTIPKGSVDKARLPLEEKHRELLYALSECLENTYVLDFRKYAPVYDSEFRKNYFLGGHMNPMGYLLTARMVISYIDAIIRSDMPRFAQVGFIGTPWKYIPPKEENK